MKKFLAAICILGIQGLNAQVITIKLTKFQNFSHSALIPTFDAMSQDLIEYPNYGIGDNIYTFDLNKGNCHLDNINGSFDMPITEFFDTKNILDCIVMDNGIRTYFTLGKIEHEDTLEFITEYEKDGRIYGSFSKGEDVSYSVFRGE
jgi:hypothetical protein